jgi:hypothetical protein
MLTELCTPVQSKADDRTLLYHRQSHDMYLSHPRFTRFVEFQSDLMSFTFSETFETFEVTKCHVLGCTKEDMLVHSTLYLALL